MNDSLFTNKNERAVDYCRVSSDEPNQLSALKAQIKEANDCIVKNGWIHVDSYVDEAKSGTSTKKRSEYNRLFEDIESNKFDIIVIKSEDRLSRNVKDWYLFIDALVKNGKKLYFYLERKFYSPDDALITGIRAILAEEYSKQLSKKINNAHKNRQAKGTSISITSQTWGYDKIDKKVVINENESEIIREIYDLAIQGYGSRSISKVLTNKGIKSRTGNPFPEVTIRKILKNPMYMGTVIMNKVHYDFDRKQSIRVPEEEWIVHKNVVPAIISLETWEKAQKEVSKRRNSNDYGDKVRGYNRGKYNLSAKIICGYCGKSYWRNSRVTKYAKREQQVIVQWRCSTYCTRGRRSSELKKQIPMVENEKLGCDNVHLHEDELFRVLTEIFGNVFTDAKDAVIDTLMNILKQELKENHHEDEKKALNQEKKHIEYQKEILLNKLLDNVISDNSYKCKNDELENRLLNIETNLQNIIKQESKSTNLEERINIIKERLETDICEDASLELMIEYINQIIVFKDRLEVYLDIFGNKTIMIEDKNKLSLKELVNNIDNNSNNSQNLKTINSTSDKNFSVCSPKQIPESRR